MLQIKKRQIKKEVKCEYCGRKVLVQYQEGERVIWEWLKPKLWILSMREGYWRHDCDSEDV